MQNIQETSHNFNSKGFIVLNVEKNRNKRDMCEMLNIKLQTHSINEQQDTSRLSDLYSNV